MDANGKKPKCNEIHPITKSIYSGRKRRSNPLNQVIDLIYYNLLIF